MIRPLLSALFLSLIIISAEGQKATLSGVLKDGSSKDPLEGATVIYDSNNMTSTDAAGRFSLSLGEGEHELVFSFLGYKTVTEKITLSGGENKVFNLELKPTAIQLDQVVSVSQYKKNSAKETISTDVIDRKKIKHWNANDLGEVVSRTPGVLVQDGQISIRGGSSWSYGVGSHTAVLSDGLSLMSADFGESQNKMVAVESIKQVEIIKGASSVVYGSSALNGVVNVVTQWPTQNEPKTSIDMNYKVVDQPALKPQKWWISPPMQTNINFNYQQRIKNLEIIAGGNLTGIKGFLKESDEFRVRTSFKLRYLHPKIEGLNFGINGSVMYERSERFFIALDLDTDAYRIRLGSEDRYARTNIDPFLNYTKTKGNFSHGFSTAWRFMNIFRKGNGDDPNSVSNQLIIDNQYQFRYKDMFVLTTGVPVSFAFSTSNFFTGVRPNFNWATYAQLEYNYKILTIQGGIRYELAGVDRSIVQGAPVFRSGINVQASKATFIRASWGQGFRIPTIGERYVTSEFLQGLLVVPNDTLKSERGWNLEIGIKQGFQFKKWKAYADFAIFYQQYDNFIEMQVGVYDNQYSNGTPIFTPSLEFPFPGTGKVLGLRGNNIVRARVAGYEIGFHSSGPIGPIGLQIFAGYTYTWPGQDPKDAEGRSTYSMNDYFKDMFKYTYRNVTDSLTQDRLLYYRLRHMLRADIEIDFWRCYIGFSANLGSVPEKIPPLFKLTSNVLFGDLNAIEKYLSTRQRGDYYFDARCGIHFNAKVHLGFIVSNITNRYYSFRPGKPEAPRSYTVQFVYDF